jgi:hypothetical protein
MTRSVPRALPPSIALVYWLSVLIPEFASLSVAGIAW